MKMSKTMTAVVAIVAAGWLVIMMAMVAMAATRDADKVQGSLSSTLEEISAAGLTGTAISPFDVYGEDWVAVGFVCPGFTDEMIEKEMNLDPSLFGTEGEVPEDENYIVVRDQGGAAHVEKFSRDELDLCASPMPGYFDSRMMIPMVKTEQGNWVLASQ